MKNDHLLRWEHSHFFYSGQDLVLQGLVAHNFPAACCAQAPACGGRFGETFGLCFTEIFARKPRVCRAINLEMQNIHQLSWMNSLWSIYMDYVSRLGYLCTAMPMILSWYQMPNALDDLEMAIDFGNKWCTNSFARIFQSSVLVEKNTIITLIAGTRVSGVTAIRGNWC